ncbi:MAG: cobalamin B12-binding domain-containing protein [Ignavibacteriales bacterium]|nr:MAG: cobalamin B12-binding domain-containing protein [Ignavibacteriales bacterium]
MKKQILCVPFDPVHDVGIKIIKAELDSRGHNTKLLSPDLAPELIVKEAASVKYDFIMVSRTLGYGVAELLARFIDMLDSAGVRDYAKIIIGGKPITPELAAELGFDKGFGEHSSVEEVIAYIEGREYISGGGGLNRVKKDITAGYDYTFHDSEIQTLLEIIAEKSIAWAKGKTSPGIKRARLRREIARNEGAAGEQFRKEYLLLCDTEIAESNRGRYIKGVRPVSREELHWLGKFTNERKPVYPAKIQHHDKHPLFFKFLGSGCPVMDLAHAKICERYGVDGFLIINPSWEARYEGLIEGCLTHENDGTITSLKNIELMRNSLDKGTLLSVRAHRGLNTPETVELAGLAGADLVKINLVYGSLGAGTDPVRLLIDGIEAMKTAAGYGLPFDIPGNDELSGVPSWKTLAGLLINVMMGKKLGAKGILKPLFCYGPHIVINGLMKQNFVDYNAAKIYTLRKLVSAPVWPGEPVAFMTQSEERVQSATATGTHAALASGLGADAVTIASTDEAYSRGPICVTSRIDSIRAAAESLRFMGNASYQPTKQADIYSEMMTEKIRETLRLAASADHLADAISKGYLGSQEDGAYPGTFGSGTVTASE